MFAKQCSGYESMLGTWPFNNTSGVGWWIVTTWVTPNFSPKGGTDVVSYGDESAAQLRH